MRRRAFITLLGGAAAAWPVAARAQQAAMPVIGFLNAGAPTAERRNLLAAFRQALSDAGYVEGRSVSIEYRWAENQYDRLPTMAADLVRRQVRVIATPGSTPAALAAKAATRTIPIVFSVGTDPVKAGLVASLNRPGSNVTGMSYLISLLVVKQLEQLHELAPNAAVMAVLLNPKLEAAASMLEDAQVAARALGLPIHVLYASTEPDLDTVFASLTQLQAGGLVISADAFFFSRLGHLVGLATRYSVPTVYPWREAVAAGGLVSYGASVTDGYRLAGVYTGRILMGDKPADLPVQQSTKTELVINLKTAKALGLIVPPSLLARADEVIE